MEQAQQRGSCGWRQGQRLTWMDDRSCSPSLKVCGSAYSRSPAPVQGCFSHLTALFRVAIFTPVMKQVLNDRVGRWPKGGRGPLGHGLTGRWAFWLSGLRPPGLLAFGLKASGPQAGPSGAPGQAPRKGLRPISQQAYKPTSRKADEPLAVGPQAGPDGAPGQAPRNSLRPASHLANSPTCQLATGLKTYSG
jgi:hypothetical protein